MTDYIKLITSEHKKPKFQALVSLLTGAIDANTQLINAMPALFDVDIAIGQQLDFVGQWIGFSRYIHPAINNAFFSLDDVNLGLDFGYLAGLYDVGGVTVLDDPTYRQLLYAKIALNNWDGSIPNGLAELQLAFPNNTIVIVDNNDMSMLIGITGVTTPLIRGLLVRGYFDIRPAGVNITAYIAPLPATIPFFGLDYQNSLISGLDTGSLDLILT